jgi:hypothetical protein
MNPWLALPLEDYEGHMSSNAVNQLVPLADLFGEALARLRPRSVAILGVAGGNGLQHVDGTITARVVGIDVNPDYLAATRERFPDPGRWLFLHRSPSAPPPAGAAGPAADPSVASRALHRQGLLVRILRTEVDCARPRRRGRQETTCDESWC